MQQMTEAKAAIDKALLHVRENQRALAFRELLDARRWANDDSVTLIQITDIMIQVQEYGAAIEILSDLSQLHPEDYVISLRIIEAKSYQRLIRSDRSILIKSLQDMIALPSFPNGLFVRVSVVFHRLRDVGSALFAAKRALDADETGAVIQLLETHDLNKSLRRSDAFRSSTTSIPEKQTRDLLKLAQTYPDLTPIEASKLSRLAERFGMPDLAAGFAASLDNKQKNMSSRLYYCRRLIEAEKFSEAAQLLVEKLEQQRKPPGTELLLTVAQTLALARRADLEHLLLLHLSELNPGEARFSAAAATSKWLGTAVRNNTSPVAVDDLTVRIQCLWTITETPV